VTVGLQICYDIRFPELTRALAIGGASLVTVSAAWQAGLFKEEHWVTLLRARAIENTIWIAAAGQVPDAGAKPTRAPTGVGRSMLIDPLGVVRCDLGPSAGLAVVDADMALVETVRSTLPSLANRREDLFWKN
jgi:deaminated glutathione amidase